MKVGIGYDIHRLRKGRRLFLGGVEIPFSKGLTGHSDGDVVLHAILDAVLGAMGEGDIGEHFPSSDPKWKNAPSLLFVKKVNGLLKKRKLKVSSIDSTIVAEAPRLMEHKDRIRRSVAQAFDIPVSEVSVKAKTNEGLGDVGKQRAIACFAVAALGK